MCVAWLVHVSGMTHSCVCHTSFICVHRYTALNAWAAVSRQNSLWHDSLICETLIIHVSFMRVTWLIHVCAMIYLCVTRNACYHSMWHDSISCVWQRAAKNISLTMKTQACTTKPEIPQKTKVSNSLQTQVYRSSFWRKSHIHKYPVPIPTDPGMTYRNGRLFPG